MLSLTWDPNALVSLVSPWLSMPIVALTEGNQLGIVLVHAESMLVLVDSSLPFEQLVITRLMLQKYRSNVWKS